MLDDLIHCHSSEQHLLVPHLKTFVTPSRLQSSPSFPNRDSTSFKISLGSTSTPAIPEIQRIAAYNLVFEGQMMSNSLLGAFCLPNHENMSVMLHLRPTVSAVS